MERTITDEFCREMGVLLESINLKYDYDFRQYASASLKRTLVHALNRMGCHTLTELQEKVIHHEECFYELIQILTIPVSAMFRDPSFFLALRQQVIPHLKTYPSLKVWVAGCSSGEEVYSLAILLQEENLLERTIIYATDINPRTLAMAEKGVFSLKEVQDASQNHQKSGGKRLLSDYYKIAGDSAKFDSALKKNVIFADHSLVTDAVFSETHLILCRNVIIYFNRALQNRVFGLFNESLCRKCFLGLGSNETVRFSQYAKYFDSFVAEQRIFQNK